MKSEEIEKLLDSRKGCFCHRIGICEPWKYVLEYIKNIENTLRDIEKRLQNTNIANSENTNSANSENDIDNVKYKKRSKSKRNR